MWNESRLKPLEKSPVYPGGASVFADQTSSRPLVADTVARGQARTDLPLYEGREHAPGRPLVTTFPFPITRQDSGSGPGAFQHLLFALSRPDGSGQRHDRAARVFAAALPTIFPGCGRLRSGISTT